MFNNLYDFLPILLEVLPSSFTNLFSCTVQLEKPTNLEFIALVADKLQVHLKSGKVANY